MYLKCCIIHVFHMLSSALVSCVQSHAAITAMNISSSTKTSLMFFFSPHFYLSPVPGNHYSTLYPWLCLFYSFLINGIFSTYNVLACFQGLSASQCISVWRAFLFLHNILLSAHFILLIIFHLDIKVLSLCEQCCCILFLKRKIPKVLLEALLDWEGKETQRGFPRVCHPSFFSLARVVLLPFCFALSHHKSLIIPELVACVIYF